MEGLQEFLNITDEQAQQINDLISGKLEPETFASVEKMIAQCFHRPNAIDMILTAINEIIDGHGIEAVTMEDAYIDHYYFDIVGLYINMGDTYNPTILFDTEDNEFTATTWGDFYEMKEVNMADGY